jgi:hypothetical protein
MSELLQPSGTSLDSAKSTAALAQEFQTKCEKTCLVLRRGPKCPVARQMMTILGTAWQRQNLP